MRPTRGALALAGLLLAGGALAPAQEQGAADEQVAAVLEMVDADRDGVLTLYEVRLRLREYMGKLRRAGEDEQKKEALVTEYSYALQPGQFLMADADDDLRVSRDELLGLINMLQGGEKPKLSGADCYVLARETVDLEWEWLLDSADADGDRKFSQAEWDGPEPDEAQRALFARADLDGDGKLDHDETALLYVERTLREHGFGK